MPDFLTNSNMHQIQYRLGNLQHSPDPLAGEEGAGCPSPKPHPLGTSGLDSGLSHTTFGNVPALVIA